LPGGCRHRRGNWNFLRDFEFVSRLAIAFRRQWRMLIQQVQIRRYFAGMKAIGNLCAGASRSGCDFRVANFADPVFKK